MTNTKTNLMLQMFDAIHLLHQDAKMVHRDIKLDNFRVDDQGQVKMIDFGIVAEYFDSQKGCHYTQYEILFQGTPLTGSISALEGRNHSRRDDLESLAYTFMYLFDHNKIPWARDSVIGDILVNKRKFIADPQVPLEF